MFLPIVQRCQGFCQISFAAWGHPGLFLDCGWRTASSWLHLPSASFPSLLPLSHYRPSLAVPGPPHPAEEKRGIRKKPTQLVPAHVQKYWWVVSCSVFIAFSTDARFTVCILSTQNAKQQRCGWCYLLQLLFFLRYLDFQVFDGCTAFTQHARGRLKGLFGCVELCHCCVVTTEVDVELRLSQIHTRPCLVDNLTELHQLFLFGLEKIKRGELRQVDLLLQKRCQMFIIYIQTNPARQRLTYLFVLLQATGLFL